MSGLTAPVISHASESTLSQSVLRKSKESARTQENFFERNCSRIIECCQAMSSAFEKGGRLIALGNGGSSCDAQHLALEFMHPIIEKRSALPAQSLATDSAFLTAIGNDEDFSLSFAKQIRMLGHPEDIALGISTSGKSSSLIRGLQAAKEIGMLTIGFSGRDGGRIPQLCDYCFVVPSFSIHRIQETHEILFHVIWDMIHVIRGQEDVL